MNFIPVSDGELQGRGLNSGPPKYLSLRTAMLGKMCSEGVAVSCKIELKGVPASEVAYLLHWTIIIIIIIIIISFMQGIYTYIPETNDLPREYTVAAVLLLLFMLPISLVPALALLCFYVSTFRSMCAVPNTVVFCSSLTSWFPGMLFTYFVNDFERVPVAPIIIFYYYYLFIYYYYYYYYWLHPLRTRCCLYPI
jgi:hypothetical protein